MFAQPAETSMDLRWTMFGIPVRVNPMFWVTSAMLGYFGWGLRNLTALGIWVLCVFASILLHELGHALTGRLFGSPSRIILMAFGGLAIGANSSPIRWQRILVVAAGPAIQLVLCLLLLFVMTNDGPTAATKFFLHGVTPIWREMNSPLLVTALGFLFWINLGWPIFNLIPIFPLDGGQIVREVCEGVAGREGIRTSLLLSMLTAGLLALDIGLRYLGSPPLLFFVRSLPVGPFTAIFIAMFAFNNYQELMNLPRSDRRPPRDEGDRWGRPTPTRRDDLPWERRDDLPWERRDDGHREPGRVRHRDDLPWER